MVVTAMSANTNISSNTPDSNSLDLAKKLVKHFEGLALKPYICAGGMFTIGYGHVITKYDQIPATISQLYLEQLLQQDLLKALVAVRKYCNVPLTTPQEAALISFTFNCGSGALQASTLRQKLNRMEYQLAADELLKWVHAGGVKLKGLVKRRRAERNLFLYGALDV